MATGPDPVSEKPSPSLPALRQGLRRCRQAYPRYPWPATADREGWLRVADRWQSGCYGMTDEVFLQAVEDHLTGPYKQYPACPGHLWVAVDLRREAELAAGQEPVAEDPQTRVAGYIANIRKQLGGKQDG